MAKNFISYHLLNLLSVECIKQYYVNAVNG